jgi:hypothetical protein
MTFRLLSSRRLASLRVLNLALACILFVSALTGCSSFISKKRLDMCRFAEDMIAVAGEIQYSLGQNQAIYIRDYIDTPEMVPLRIQTERAKGLVRGVISYSIQLVTVGDSRKPGPEQALALAGYLEDALQGVIGGPEPPLDLTRTELDTILADIRGQKKFLDAISASGKIFDDTKSAMDTAVVAVRRRIKERFHDVRLADELLERRQIQTVFNIAYLPQIRMGVPGALDSLLVNEPSLPALVDTRDGLDASEIQRIEDRLLTILTRLREVRDQLEPDIEMYYQQQNELDKMENLWHAELRKARVSVVAWARAHKRMAQGITDPASIDILGIARKASGTILPIP